MLVKQLKAGGGDADFTDSGLKRDSREVFSQGIRRTHCFGVYGGNSAFLGQREYSSNVRFKRAGLRFHLGGCSSEEDDRFTLT